MIACIYYILSWLNDPKMLITGGKTQSADSPKPFDASLFENMEDTCEDQSGFLFQESESKYGEKYVSTISWN